jgi:hypothetical protein
MNEMEMCKAAFIRGADFAAVYLGEPIPLDLIEKAFVAWADELKDQ